MLFLRSCSPIEWASNTTACHKTYCTWRISCTERELSFSVYAPWLRCYVGRSIGNHNKLYYDAMLCYELRYDYRWSDQSNNQATKSHKRKRTTPYKCGWCIRCSTSCDKLLLLAARRGDNYAKTTACQDRLSDCRIILMNSSEAVQQQDSRATHEKCMIRDFYYLLVVLPFIAWFNLALNCYLSPLFFICMMTYISTLTTHKLHSSVCLYFLTNYTLLVHVTFMHALLETIKT